MADPITIDNILSDFRALRSNLRALDDELDQERREIRLQAFKEGRAETADEKARRKEIAATRLETADALQALSLETIQALDSAEELQSLIQSLNLINEGLKDDLARLRALERYAELAAKAADGLSKGLEKLAKVVF